MGPVYCAISPTHARALDPPSHCLFHLTANNAHHGIDLRILVHKTVESGTKQTETSTVPRKQT
jgi:hypothetical protein